MMETARQVGNPSSMHRQGRAARAVLDSARDVLSEALGVKDSEIIFTSGGTEADNLAVTGGARWASGSRRVLVSAVEHHAVIHSAQALAVEGFEVEILPVDAAGRVGLLELARRLNSGASLVSVMTGNNEIGTLQPVAEIAAVCRAAGVLFHTDAVQAFGHLPINIPELGVDMLSISAHKFGGPPGAGALWVKDGVSIRPTQFGGAQERGRRGGTENAPAIAGMAAAVRVAMASLDDESARLRRLAHRLRSGLLENPGTWLNTPLEGTLPGILNVGFEDVPAEMLLVALDLDGIAASSGSACASGSMEPSHVLSAIGLAPERAKSCVRFSAGWTTTEADIDRAIEVAAAAVARARKALSRRGKLS
jgi:cysteine desulfurase